MNKYNHSLFKNNQLVILRTENIVIMKDWSFNLVEIKERILKF